MLVATTPEAYRFVTQPEHGTQVGRIAEQWGNDTFAEPTPRSPSLLAAEHHDAGWYDYDLTPHLVDGEPASVLDTTREEWTAFYDHGIAAVAERDPYAGLLCAMHGAGVRRGRYGTQSDLPDTSTEFAAFIAEQESRQLALLDRLADETDLVDDTDREALEALHDGRLPSVESGVFRNYRLLQTWDRLSLLLCTTTTHEETTVGPVPVAPDEADTTLTVTPTETPEAFEVDPYPFEGSKTTVPVRTRTVSRGHAETEEALVEAYYAAPVETASFVFVTS